MSETLTILDEQPSPLEHQPDGKRALVRVVDEVKGHPTRVSFGIARNQGTDGAMVLRVPCGTLKAARETFTRTKYP